MRDKRPVDELSIEELERILAIRKREEREKRLRRMRDSGRVIETPPAVVNGGTGGDEKKGITRPVPMPPAVPIPQPAVETVPPEAAAVPVPRELPTSPQFDDEGLSEEITPQEQKADPETAKKITNRFLLLIEVAAVFGLIFLGVNMFSAIGNLQRETAEAQRIANERRIASIPTAEPTAIISLKIEDYVLPGGHTVDANGNYRFNQEEFEQHVPIQLRGRLIEQVISVDYRRPALTEEDAERIIIDKLGIDESIVPGTDEEALRQGVGRVLNGAIPGNPTGNVALAAHNDVYGELFRNLPDMVEGDRFFIQTRTRTYEYEVFDTRIVNPDDVYVLEDQGYATATLITCYPPGVNNKRFVVFARRLGEQGF